MKEVFILLILTVAAATGCAGHGQIQQPNGEPLSAEPPSGGYELVLFFSVLPVPLQREYLVAVYGGAEMYRQDGDHRTADEIACAALSLERIYIANIATRAYLRTGDEAGQETYWRRLKEIDKYERLNCY